MLSILCFVWELSRQFDVSDLVPNARGNAASFSGNVWGQLDSQQCLRQRKSWPCTKGAIAAQSFKDVLSALLQKGEMLPIFRQELSTGGKCCPFLSSIFFSNFGVNVGELQPIRLQLFKVLVQERGNAAHFRHETSSRL